MSKTRQIPREQFITNPMSAAVKANRTIAELEAEVAELRAAMGGVLHQAEAWHRQQFGIACDHDDDCHCDREALSTVALTRARAALTPTADGGEREGGSNE